MSAPKLADVLATVFTPRKKFRAAAVETLGMIAERHRNKTVKSGKKRKKNSLRTEQVQLFRDPTLVGSFESEELWN